MYVNARAQMQVYLIRLRSFQLLYYLPESIGLLLSQHTHSRLLETIIISERLITKTISRHF